MTLLQQVYVTATLI